MLRFRECYKQLAVTIMLVVVFIFLMSIITDKPSITQATRDDLIEVEYIGEVRADSILKYVTINPDASVDDLIIIDGIGEVIIRKLRWSYK